MALLRSRSIFHFSVLVFRWITVAALLGTSFSLSPVQAQTVGARTPKDKSSPATDLSVGGFGQFTLARSPTNILTQPEGTTFTQTIQGSSVSAGVMGSFHQSFGRWLGYDVNIGFSRFSEHYSQGIDFVPNPKYVPRLVPTSSFSWGSVGTDMYELTGAYLVQGPRTRRYETFAQVGAGVLTFLPAQDPSPYSLQFRPALLFGTGVNYELSSHWALRAEYRGFFLKNPNMHASGGAGFTSKLYTVTSEPAISIVYRFGVKH